MRSIDAINGEIGQLEGQIRRHEQRVQELMLERAEAKLTQAGYVQGCIVEAPWGKARRRCVVTGYGVRNNASVLVVRPFKKDGTLGEQVQLSFWATEDATKMEETPCA